MLTPTIGRANAPVFSRCRAQGVAICTQSYAQVLWITTRAFGRVGNRGAVTSSQKCGRLFNTHIEGCRRERTRRRSPRRGRRRGVLRDREDSRADVARQQMRLAKDQLKTRPQALQGSAAEPRTCPQARRGRAPGLEESRRRGGKGGGGEAKAVAKVAASDGAATRTPRNRAAKL